MFTKFTIINFLILNSLISYAQTDKEVIEIYEKHLNIAHFRIDSLSLALLNEKLLNSKNANEIQILKKEKQELISKLQQEQGKSKELAIQLIQMEQNFEMTKNDYLRSSLKLFAVNKKGNSIELNDIEVSKSKGIQSFRLRATGSSSDNDNRILEVKVYKFPNIDDDIGSGSGQISKGEVSFAFELNTPYEIKNGKYIFKVNVNKTEIKSFNVLFK